jgi:hypothetical protein
MVERQKQLEHALLHLGQFQHALNELLVWISKTDGTLDQLKPVSFVVWETYKSLLICLMNDKDQDFSGSNPPSKMCLI